jgi:hypothetical protein
MDCEQMFCWGSYQRKNRPVGCKFQTIFNPQRVSLSFNRQFNQTHNVAMASKVADFVVSLGVDGRIHSQGSISDAIVDNEQLKEEVIADEEISGKAEETVDGDHDAEIAKAADKKKSDGKLVVTEEIDQGHVSASASRFSHPHMREKQITVFPVRLFTSAVGGNHPYIFWFISLSFLVLTEFGVTFQVWFLGMSFLAVDLVYALLTSLALMSSRILGQAI